MKIFSEDYEKTLKKAQLGYDIKRYSFLIFTVSFLGSILITLFFLLIFIKQDISASYLTFVFLVSFFAFFFLIKIIPDLTVKNRKASLESDLLYSARHLLLKLESGSSLLNSLESVSKLNTKSSLYFKELVLDISMGVSIEDAIEKAIVQSPSHAYIKLLEEVQSSLKTGADIQKTLKSTLEDITKEHLIAIEEYGKKLNPMSMFYMIIGTIVPSLGTAMLVVASSLLPGVIIIDLRILFAIAFLLLIVQIFFILAFRSLKPPVMA